MTNFDQDYSDRSFAVYSTVNLNRTSLDELLRLVNQDLDGLQQAKLAPASHFIKPTIKDILETHRQLADETGNQFEYHPDTFLIVVDLDYLHRGVLLASTNYDGTKRPDSFRVPTEGAAGRLVGIELGESSWEESKDEAEGEMAALATRLDQSKLQEEDSGTAQSSDRPQTKYKFAVYRLHKEVRMPRLASLLNGEDFYNFQVNEHTFRIPPWTPSIRLDDNTDNLAAIKIVHERSVPTYPEFHPYLAVAVEVPDVEQQGLLLVNFRAGQVYQSRSMALGDLKIAITALAAGEQVWDQ